MNYKSGDNFLNAVERDFNCFGHAFVMVEDNENFYRCTRIPPSLILGGYYYA